jgi:glycine amidinotransferase
MMLQILVNPKRPCITDTHRSYYTYDGSQTEIKLPDMFKGWEVFVAEKPILPDRYAMMITHITNT